MPPRLTPTGLRAALDPMNLKSYLLPFALLAAWAASPWAAAQSADRNVVSSERARAELMVHAPEGVAPGKPVWVGLHLAHQPGWHSYWKNSGDSGLPTQLQWTLPAGVVAGDIAWPVPSKIPFGTLTNYGYGDTVLLPVPLTITPEFKPSSLTGDLEVKLKAQWLVCFKVCIPEEGEFTLRVSAKSTTAINGPAFDASFAAQPKPLQGESVVTPQARSLELRVSGLPASLQGKTLELFPETGDVIDNSAKPNQAWQGTVWTTKVPLSAQRSNSPSVMPIVVTAGGQGWRTEARVIGEWPQQTAQAGAGSELQAALRSDASSGVLTAASSSTLVAALLGALLGGLILNFMPCVFPVLAIKVVGFARDTGNQRHHRMGGLAYAAGVVTSFVALGGLVLVLRAGGEQLGWGFHLQSPPVVAALAVLFTVLGLNLAGLFEFRALVASRIASLEMRHPIANAFLSGALAVAIASPCTAPFMGASLGLAMALPPMQALLVFAALGAGMALPYLAASWIPGIARFLPRPGPWMATFRQAMAFPMFATVVWLAWVLGQQSGIDGAAALLILLVALSALIWVMMRSNGRTRPLVVTCAAASLSVLAWFTVPVVSAGAPQPAAESGDGPWGDWAPGRVEQLLASGQPVFVDFTAAWCVTCQYNKKTVLADATVLSELSRNNVALLRADWTRRDPAITSALAQLGRSGVPVYVFYKLGRAPVVLSEIPSVKDMRSAIAGLSGR